MNKHKWHWALITALLMSLIVPTAGCVTIVRQETTAPQELTAPPAINSFTATPTNISLGQRTTLSWDVSGATTVTIEPEIGSSGSSGWLQLSPAANTTYTLTATNEAGNSTSTVTVTVKPAATGKPDLVITEIWFTGVLYYKIKNQGDASSTGSRSYLYVNGPQGANSYVPSLAPGEEKTDSFSNYIWNVDPSAPVVTSAPQQDQPTTYVKVCADGENTVDESDKGNNCTTKIWGPTFTYEFAKQAHLAKWQSDAGDLKLPMATSDKKGAILVQYNDLVMCPQQVRNGWIQGRFADFYTDPETGATRSREIKVPAQAKFTAKVGFGQYTTSTDGVLVAFGYLDTTGSVALFPKIDVYSDGTWRLYEIDLSDMAGKKTEFILWVEAKDSPEGDCVRWVEPKIVQEP